MPGSEAPVLLLLLSFGLLTGGCIALVMVAWWQSRTAMWCVMRANLRLEDSLRDANTCLISLSQKPYSIDFAAQRETTDRDVRMSEIDQNTMPIDNGHRPQRMAMPTT